MAYYCCCYKNYCHFSAHFDSYCDYYYDFVIYCDYSLVFNMKHKNCILNSVVQISISYFYYNTHRYLNTDLAHSWVYIHPTMFNKS